MINRFVFVLTNLIQSHASVQTVDFLLGKTGILYEFIGDFKFFCAYISVKLKLLNEYFCNAFLNPKFIVSWGKTHVYSQYKYNLICILSKLGFTLVKTQEISDVNRNFLDLNFPEFHSSFNLTDTFYIAGEKTLLLRTHTTACLKQLLFSKHCKCFTIGKVYRQDFDSTHLPCFTQLEGLVINKNCNVFKIISIVINVLRSFLCFDFQYRVRNSYFPFTDPSFEIDVCKNSQFSSFKPNYFWNEVAGIGVLRNYNYAYAFGIGFERLLMIKLNLLDIKQLCI